MCGPALRYALAGTSSPSWYLEFRHSRWMCNIWLAGHANGFWRSNVRTITIVAAGVITCHPQPGLQKSGTSLPPSLPALLGYEVGGQQLWHALSLSIVHRAHPSISKPLHIFFFVSLCTVVCCARRFIVLYCTLHVLTALNSIFVVSIFSRQDFFTVSL